MKVLSLTESYATLIKENKKLIETRSWKTDYREANYIFMLAPLKFQKNGKKIKN